MPKLEAVDGSYAHNQMIQPLGFQLGASNSVLRDGTNVATASGKMFTVTKTSTGLYTIALAQKTPWPELPFILPVLEQAAAPTSVCKVRYVKGSYSKSTRSFQVQVTLVSTGAASDGDAGDRCTIFLVGSITSVGTDPA